MDYYLDCPVPIFDSIRKKPVGIIGPVPNLRVPVKHSTFKLEVLESEFDLTIENFDFNF